MGAVKTSLATSLVRFSKVAATWVAFSPRFSVAFSGEVCAMTLDNRDMEWIQRAIDARCVAMDPKISAVDARLGELVLRSDVIGAVLALVQLAASPTESVKVLRQLGSATEKAAKAQAALAAERRKLDEDKAAFGRKVAADEAALEQARDLLKRTKSDIEREAVRRHIKEHGLPRDPRTALVPVGPGGLTREPDLSERPVDAHFL